MTTPYTCHVCGGEIERDRAERGCMCIPCAWACKYCHMGRYEHVGPEYKCLYDALYYDAYVF